MGKQRDRWKGITEVSDPWEEKGLAESTPGAKERKFVVIQGRKEVPVWCSPEEIAESGVMEFPLLGDTEGTAEHVHQGVAGAWEVNGMQCDPIPEAPSLLA